MRILKYILFVLSLSISSALSVYSSPNEPDSGQMPKVPEYLEFAGERIRFDRADMRERLDRELIAFTYSHSTSILMIKRANRYFPQVEPILKAQGLPDDMKYLMVIESNLDPQALSAAGAAGLWQFTQSTARAYGLEVNSNIDERYDLKKETVAACKYLLSAYEKYGDWLTVAASYNAGQNGISARLENQHQTRAVDLWLLNETSRYMFRLLVAKMMFENPAQFGFHLSADELYPFVPCKDTVEVTETVADLVTFAESYGVTYADLKRENLWLRESSLKDTSHKLYKVAIPDVKGLHYNPRHIRPHNPAWVTK